jgi:hypothetical protein
MAAPTDDKLVVFWSKREKDFLFRFPRSADGHYVNSVFCSDRPRVLYTRAEREDNGGSPVAYDPSFVKELERRGYDTTTLRFSVQRRKAET